MLATAGSDEIDMRRTLEDFPIRSTSVRDYAHWVASQITPSAPQHA